MTGLALTRSSVISSSLLLRALATERTSFTVAVSIWKLILQWKAPVCLFILFVIYPQQQLQLLCERSTPCFAWHDYSFVLRGCKNTRRGLISSVNSSHCYFIVSTLVTVYSWAYLIPRDMRDKMVEHLFQECDACIYIFFFRNVAHSKCTAYCMEKLIILLRLTL